MSQSAVELLGLFAEQYNKVVRDKTGSLPQIAQDPDWPSPCEQGEADSGQMIGWQPVRRKKQADFSGLENAMELTLHPSVVDYYGHYYSGPLLGMLAERELELLQIWNKDDQDRLQQNIIGHLLMQKKLKHSPTVFIGCVHNSEQMVSIDNETGAVVLEVAGVRERQVIAGSLSDFLKALQPLAELAPEQAYQAPKSVDVGLMPRLKEIWRSLLGR